MNPLAPAQPTTFNASLERRPPKEILRQSSVLDNLSGFPALLDYMPDWVMIRKEQPQIIFGKKSLRDFSGAVVLRKRLRGYRN